MVHSRFAAVLAHLAACQGVDLGPTLERHGLTPHVNGALGRISRAQLDALWEAAEAQAPAFGPRAVQHTPMHLMHPFGLIILNCETVRDALQQWKRLHHVFNPTLRLDIEEGPEGLALRVGGAPPLPLPWRSYLFGFVLHLLRSVTSAPEGAALALRFPDPPPAAAERYGPLLGAPVAFGCDECALLLAPGVADARFHFANPALRQVAEQVLHQKHQALHTGQRFLDRCRDAALEGLERGEVSVEGVASAVGMSPRSLQRRLRQEGTTFRALVDEVRFSLARMHLKAGIDDELELAFLLGYATQSAFSRAFRRWAGSSPRAWKATNLG